MKKLLMLVMIAAVASSGFGVNAQDTKPANVAGTWEISLTFILGTATHTAMIEQDGGKLSGTYKGEYLEGRLSGKVTGSDVEFSGRIRHEATGVTYRYTGTIDGDTMKGTVSMGEYWTAEFTAKRKK